MSAGISGGAGTSVGDPSVITALAGGSDFFNTLANGSPCVGGPSGFAKRLGIKTGTLLREARRLCPGVIPLQANLECSV
jgi:hypothetical protein